ncbi:hypothetical protein DF125_02855 [Burkholderia pseudomallei]|nr:hypothetical protein DF127_05705 [Burkholderia pseudomallei]RQS99015.1 hypothetical protein DF125_02855 [Burkholderia pseudomallei]
MQDATAGRNGAVRPHLDALRAKQCDRDHDRPVGFQSFERCLHRLRVAHLDPFLNETQADEQPAARVGDFAGHEFDHAVHGHVNVCEAVILDVRLGIQGTEGAGRRPASAIFDVVAAGAGFT